MWSYLLINDQISLLFSAYVVAVFTKQAIIEKANALYFVNAEGKVVVLWL